MIQPEVSVVIPTRRRPESLRRAVESVLGSDAEVLFEVVVVDNDPAGSAARAVEALASRAAVPVIYVSAPDPGVANARNAGLAASRAPLIAFLDDDEEASARWLDQLMRVQAEFDADVVFGPVRAAVPAEVTRHRAYFERFFSREGPPRAGPIDHAYGCGNSLLRKSAIPDPATPFAAERNHIGGEDDLLFGQMRAAGARFAWAPWAEVLEHPGPERCTLSYACRRAFAFGQGPASAAAAAGGARLFEVPLWMAVGLAQAAAFGLAGALAVLAQAPGRAAVLDRAARGLGKTLWFPPFKQHFYGRGSA